MRETWRGCVEQAAFCQDCDWQYANRKNGLAMAAKHHDKTGHTVNIDIYNSVTYGHPNDAGLPTHEDVRGIMKEAVERGEREVSNNGA